MDSDIYTSMVKRTQNYLAESQIYLSEKQVLKNGYLTQVGLFVTEVCFMVWREAINIILSAMFVWAAGCCWTCRAAG